MTEVYQELRSHCTQMCVVTRTSYLTLQMINRIFEGAQEIMKTTHTFKATTSNDTFQ